MHLITTFLLHGGILISTKPSQYRTASVYVKRSLVGEHGIRDLLFVYTLVPSPQPKAGWWYNCYMQLLTQHEAKLQSILSLNCILPLLLTLRYAVLMGTLSLLGED